MEWSCIGEVHKPFVFNDSGREYCKKCGKLLRDYPKEVEDALLEDDDTEMSRGFRACGGDTGARPIQKMLPFNGEWNTDL